MSLIAGGAPRLRVFYVKDESITKALPFFIFCRAHAGYVLVLTHWPGLDTYGSSVNRRKYRRKYICYIYACLRKGIFGDNPNVKNVVGQSRGARVSTYFGDERCLL